MLGVGVMRRIKVSFAGLEVEFTDRDKALQQVEEVAEKGTFPVYVIYGPEGCGKTALLRQAKVILEEGYGYNVIYLNPAAERIDEILDYTPAIGEVVREVAALIPDPYSRIVDAAISVARRVLKRFSGARLAVLMDDVFQAVGLDRAEVYTKALLNLIEWPPASYERIVVLVTSSEGLSRERIGRHNWATTFILWNMHREGFRILYEELPGAKPGFEQAWIWTGGNPRYLERLYKNNWDVENLINEIIKDRGLMKLINSLTRAEAEILEQALEDPDVLLKRYSEVKGLINELIGRNLVIEIWDRDERFWIDTPPPEKDPKLGIGRYYAWQTPLHREAIKKTLEIVV